MRERGSDPHLSHVALLSTPRAPDDGEGERHRDPRLSTTAALPPRFYVRVLASAVRVVAAVSVVRLVRRSLYFWLLDVTVNVYETLSENVPPPKLFSLAAKLI